MEARLYAEDPATGFLPSHRPARPFRARRGTACGSTPASRRATRISPYYDPMIAKLIATRATRAGDAIDRLVDALRAGRGLAGAGPTPRFLARAAADPDFRAGDVDTGFIAGADRQLVPAAGAVRRVWNARRQRMLASTSATSAADPWTRCRVSASMPRRRPRRRASPTAATTADRARRSGRAPRRRSAAIGETVLVFSDRARPSPSTCRGAAARRRQRGWRRARSCRRCRARSSRSRSRQGDTVDQGPEAAHARGDEDGAQPDRAVRRHGRRAQRSEGAQVSEGTLLARIEKGER